MKKILPWAMASIMFLGGIGYNALPVSAADGNDVTKVVVTTNQEEYKEHNFSKAAKVKGIKEKANKAKAAKVKVKKLDGYQRLLELKAERKTIKEQIKADRKLVAAEIKKARKEKKKEIAKEYCSSLKDIKTMQQDLKVLWDKQKTNWIELKNARNQRNETEMKKAMEKIVATGEEINKKLLDIDNELKELLK
ncbi:hypothetical protein RDV78_04965 [Bacillota bacterium LX-D]|nr:hypothetical protein [Bacillota bacterium LX-D]